MTTHAQHDRPESCHIILRPDEGVLLIGAELQRAHEQLTEAEQLAVRLQRVVTLLLEGKVDDGTPDDAAEVERAALRQVLLRRGGPAVLSCPAVMSTSSSTVSTSSASRSSPPSTPRASRALSLSLAPETAFGS